MKIFSQIIFGLAFLITCNSTLPGQVINWQNCYGGSKADGGWSLLKTSNGFIILGQSESRDDQIPENYGKTDLCVLWVDSLGNFMHAKNYGGVEIESTINFVATPDGGYLLFGDTFSYGIDIIGNHGGNDLWVVKIDSIGNIQWKKCYGGSSLDNAMNIINTPYDSGFLLAGETASDNGDITLNHGPYDIWLVKLDKHGEILWQKTYGGTDDECPFGLLLMGNGEIFVTGRATSIDGDVSCNPNLNYTEGWVLKLNSNGEIIWQQCYGGMYLDVVTDIISIDDSNFLCAGVTKSNNGTISGNHGGEDFWIFKIDYYGNLIWSKCYGGSNNDRISKLRKSKDGNYYALGITHSYNGDVQGNSSLDPYYGEGWLIKISPEGELLWQKCFGGHLEDGIADFVELDNGNLILLGSTHSIDLSGNVSCNFHGYLDIWLLSISDTSFVGVNDYKFCDLEIKIFPNPSNSYVQIQYSFNKSRSSNKLTIVDAFGRIVQAFELIDRKGQILWLPQNKGIYFVFSNENTSKPQKIIYY